LSANKNGVSSVSCGEAIIGDAVRCPFLLVVSSDMCVAEENKEQENEMRDLQQRPAAGGG